MEYWVLDEKATAASTLSAYSPRYFPSGWHQVPHLGSQTSKFHVCVAGSWLCVVQCVSRWGAAGARHWPDVSDEYVINGSARAHKIVFNEHTYWLIITCGFPSTTLTWNAVLRGRSFARPFLACRFSVLKKGLETRLGQYNACKRIQR